MEKKLLWYEKLTDVLAIILMLAQFLSTPVRKPMQEKIALPKTPSKKKSSPRYKTRSSVSPKAKRATLSSLTPRTRLIAKKTSKFFRVKLATENAYPPSDSIGSFVHDVFKRALDGNADAAFFTERYKTDEAYVALFVDVVSQCPFALDCICNPNFRSSVEHLR